MKLKEMKFEIEKLQEYEKELKQCLQKRYVLNQQVSNLENECSLFNQEINRLQNKGGFFRLKKLEQKQNEYRNKKRIYFDLKKELDDIVYKINTLESKIASIHQMKKEYDQLFNQKVNVCNHSEIQSMIEERNSLNHEIHVLNTISEQIEKDKKICNDIDYEIGKKKYGNAAMYRTTKYGGPIVHSATGGRDDLNEKAFEYLDELVSIANQIKTNCYPFIQTHKQVIERFNESLINFEKEIVYEPFKVVDYSMLVIDFKRELNQLLMCLLEYRKSKEIKLKEINLKIENILLEE